MTWRQQWWPRQLSEPQPWSSAMEMSRMWLSVKLMCRWLPLTDKGQETCGPWKEQRKYRVQTTFPDFLQPRGRQEAVPTNFLWVGVSGKCPVLPHLQVSNTHLMATSCPAQSLRWKRKVFIHVYNSPILLTVMKGHRKGALPRSNPLTLYTSSHSFVVLWCLTVTTWLAWNLIWRQGWLRTHRDPSPLPLECWG